MSQSSRNSKNSFFTICPMLLIEFCSSTYSSFLYFNGTQRYCFILFFSIIKSNQFFLQQIVYFFIFFKFRQLLAIWFIYFGYFGESNSCFWNNMFWAKGWYHPESEATGSNAIKHSRLSTRPSLINVLLYFVLYSHFFCDFYRYAMNLKINKPYTGTPLGYAFWFVWHL